MIINSHTVIQLKSCSLLLHRFDLGVRDCDCVYAYNSNVDDIVCVDSIDAPDCLDAAYCM